MYKEKVEKLYQKYCKDFNRKDETFEMMTLYHLIEQLENNVYEDDELSDDEKNIIAKFLYQRYHEAMYKRYKYLNSKEYKEKNNF